MGFEEISHTADWSVRVWAPDVPSLFTEAALAMNALSGTRLSDGPRLTRKFEAQAPDAESLLVAFLSELVYYHEQEGLAFDRFELNVEKLALRPSQGEKLEAEMNGAQVLSVDKAIKAVTYHNLKLVETNQGLETTIVFDV